MITYERSDWLVASGRCLKEAVGVCLIYHAGPSFTHHIAQYPLGSVVRNCGTPMICALKHTGERCSPDYDTNGCNITVITRAFQRGSSTRRFCCSSDQVRIQQQGTVVLHVPTALLLMKTLVALIHVCSTCRINQQIQSSSKLLHCSQYVVLLPVV